MPVLTKTTLLVLSLCIVSLVGSALWLSYGNCTDLPRLLYHRFVLLDNDYIGKETHFQVRMMGSGRTPDGGEFDFTNIRASDCVEVVVETENLHSPSQTESEIKKRIRAASRVIEQDSNDFGLPRPDRRRVVLLFEQPKKAEIVLWSKGASKLRSIKLIFR